MPEIKNMENNHFVKESGNIPRVEEKKPDENIGDYIADEAMLHKREEKLLELNKKREKLEDNLKKIKQLEVDLGLLDDKKEGSKVKLSEEELKLIDVKIIEAESNYPGDWTLLLKERMLDPLVKERFIKLIKESVDTKEGIPLVNQTPDQIKYTKLVNNYDKFVEGIFSQTDIIRTDIPGYKLPTKSDPSGLGYFGGHGFVNINSVIEGKPLTERQKNMIEAHEKGHGLRAFVGRAGKEFKNILNNELKDTLDTESVKNVWEQGSELREKRKLELIPLRNDLHILERKQGIGKYYDPLVGDKINEIKKSIDSIQDKINKTFNDQQLLLSKYETVNYFDDLNEIAERMSQLKNYFGFKGNETFTKDHLEYARKNYIKDIGSDNEMSHLFEFITEKTEGKFLEMINNLPI